jgi:hypothetical protein
MNTHTEIETDVWRCFHCDEVFTDHESAADHFGDGDYEDETPLCIVAATTEQKQLILTNREMWDELQKARHENEDLEDRLHGFEYVARKLTKKPHANTNDLEHEWEFMVGRVIAAEAAINVAPKWLATLLRRRAERLYLKNKRRSTAGLVECAES